MGSCHMCNTPGWPIEPVKESFSMVMHGFQPWFSLTLLSFLGVAPGIVLLVGGGKAPNIDSVMVELGSSLTLIEEKDLVAVAPLPSIPRQKTFLVHVPELV